MRTDPKTLAPHAADTTSYMEDAASVLLPNGLTVVSISTISPNKVIVDMSFKSGDTVQFTV